MKSVKKIALLLLLLLVTIGFSFYIYLLSTKPKYEGHINLKNISKETTVYFSFDHDTQEIQKFYLGHSYSDALMGTSPDDERLEGVRKKLFT